MHRRFIALLGLWPALAFGQSVFFDDFGGNALKPHWEVPPPSHWEYNVSGGRLNVTGLFYPGSPHFSSNFAGIAAEFSPQADFRVDVWMGWEQGTPPHQLLLAVKGPGGNPGIAQVGYFHDPGSSPQISASATVGGAILPAPPPGIHHFAITRVAHRFEFVLNGNSLAVVPDNFGTPAGGVRFFFLGPATGQLGPLYIDRIRVVPTAGTIWFALPLGLAYALARRRRHGTPSQGVQT